LVKDEDFVAAQPFLLGENFGSIAKGKLDAEEGCLPSIQQGKTGFSWRLPSQVQLGQWGQLSTKLWPWEIQEGNQSQGRQG